MKDDEKEIVERLIEENERGLERLANEEPAEERRSRLKRFERRVRSLFKKEEDVGYIKV
mgnify:CR=1 FL=1